MKMLLTRQLVQVQSVSHVYEASYYITTQALSCYVILVTIPLLIGAANKHHHIHLMLCHVWIVNPIYSLHYCTPLILMLMIFTQSFYADDHGCIHLGSDFFM